MCLSDCCTRLLSIVGNIRTANMQITSPYSLLICVQHVCKQQELCSNQIGLQNAVSTPQLRPTSIPNHRIHAGCKRRTDYSLHMRISSKTRMYTTT